MNSLLPLTGSNRTVGGLALLSISLLHTQKLIDTVLAKGLLIFIEILDDSLTKAIRSSGKIFTALGSEVFIKLKIFTKRNKMQKLSFDKNDGAKLYTKHVKRV